MLSELKAKHREIARLRFEGFSPSEIAERMELHSMTVYNVTRDPLFKSYLEGLHDKADTATVDVRRSLAEMNAAALHTLKFLLTSGDIAPSVQLVTAKDVLDRNGHKAPDRVEHLHAHLTSADIMELKKRKEAVTTITDGVSQCEPSLSD